MGMIAGIWIQACSNESGEMSHIDHEVCANRIRDFTEPFEVNDSRIGTPAGNDDLGVVFFGKSLNFFIVDGLGFEIDTVLNGVVYLTGEVDRCAMCQMAPVAE